MSRLRLSLSCPSYDRTEALRTGEVQPEGLELSYVTMPPADAHARMLKYQEFDASDMSMSFYLMGKLSGKTPFTAIPVFPMRRFFHSEVIVNVDSGIKTPSDLKGKRIGVQEYGMTLALWLRGILEHEFRVTPPEVEWYVERNPGEKVGDSIGFKAPPDVRINQLKPETDLMTSIENHEIDAAFPYPKIWKTHRDRSNSTGGVGQRKTRPLFADPKQESIRYYRKTGFFPINHVIVIKDEILKENPWVALSLYEAFLKAKEISYAKVEAKLREPTNYVWLDDLVNEVREIFGADPYPYGLKENENILDAIATYSNEQGLTPRKAVLNDLFFYTTLDL
ncbi:MAG: ABC transporter substrate-binding protein [Thaumarchaeota archaeon]|nr:ABC transporter substrate-binding protein [Nitrososphaerota archaeon]